MENIIGQGLWSVNTQEVKSEDAEFEVLGRPLGNGELIVEIENRKHLH